MHGLQAAEADLDALVQEYGDSFKGFTEAYGQRQDEVDQSRTTARNAWTKEQDDHRRFLKERNETLHKTSQRDEAEYSYSLALERKLNTDEYELAQKELYRALTEQEQTQEKQWQERESAIAEREKQLAELKMKVESLPQELDSAIKKATEEGKGIAYKTDQG